MNTTTQEKSRGTVHPKRDLPPIREGRCRLRRSPSARLSLGGDNVFAKPNFQKLLEL